jgi:hypothetical protein
MTLAPDLLEHTQRVAAALRALESRLDALSDALAQDVLWASVEVPTRTPVRRIAESYRAIDYAMQDEANQSVTCLGVIAVPAHVKQLALAVNTAKERLRKACAPLYGRRTRVPTSARESQEGATVAIPLIRVILRRLQRSDLNLLAAYRKIPILAAPPALIVYTRARTRAVYRKTVEEIETLLATNEDPRASRDRARLAQLPLSETHLALVKEHYENIRANVRYHQLDARGRGRVQLPAELPLLYSPGRQREPPEVRYLVAVANDSSAAPRRARKTRLESEPFLATVPVYRYRRD